MDSAYCAGTLFLYGRRTDTAILRMDGSFQGFVFGDEGTIGVTPGFSLEGEKFYDFFFGALKSSDKFILDQQLLMLPFGDGTSPKIWIGEQGRLPLGGSFSGKDQGFDHVAFFTELLASPGNVYAFEMGIKDSHEKGIAFSTHLPPQGVYSLQSSMQRYVLQGSKI